MMTYEMILEQADLLGRDAFVVDWDDEISVEIARCGEEVSRFCEMLEGECEEMVVEDLYSYYHFDGFMVTVGFAFGEDE